MDINMDLLHETEHSHSMAIFTIYIIEGQQNMAKHVAF